MFTGIVEELGEVVEVTELAGSARLTVRGPVVAPGAVRGESIAVNGVCLTVTEAAGDTFRADVMGETLARSGLGGLTAGAQVNLERPMRLNGRIGGHLVQGHVDGTGTVVARMPSPNWETVRISACPQIIRYLALKGSVAVDGVSLTVSGLDESWFEVSLIPETLARTTLGTRQPGDPVNLEVDMIAKYVERLLAARSAA